MEWQIVVALVLAIPILLIPVALVWYINLGGIFVAIKEARAKRAAHKVEAEELAAAKQTVDD